MKIDPLYGAFAPEVGWVPSPSYLLRRERILKILEPLRRGDVLEIGCGAGAILIDLCNAGFRCTALDTSIPAYHLATYMNSNNKNAKIHLKPRNDWENSFDYLFAFEVLEHIEDDKQALEQWRQWLKPNGKLLISVPAKPNLWSVDDLWAGHYRRYERNSLVSILEETGFTIEHMECYGFPLLNLLHPIRSIYHSKTLLNQNNTPTGDESLALKSGIERPLECRFFPLQACWMGKLFIRFFFLLQKLSLKHDFGNGYLVLAKQK